MANYYYTNAQLFSQTIVWYASDLPASVLVTCFGGGAGGQAAGPGVSGLGGGGGAVAQTTFSPVAGQVYNIQVGRGGDGGVIVGGVRRPASNGVRSSFYDFSGFIARAVGGGLAANSHLGGLAINCVGGTIISGGSSGDVGAMYGGGGGAGGDIANAGQSGVGYAGGGQGVNNCRGGDGATVSANRPAINGETSRYPPAVVRLGAGGGGGGGAIYYTNIKLGANLTRGAQGGDGMVVLTF